MLGCSEPAAGRCQQPCCIHRPRNVESHLSLSLSLSLSRPLFSPASARRRLRPRALSGPPARPALRTHTGLARQAVGKRWLLGTRHRARRGRPLFCFMASGCSSSPIVAPCAGDCGVEPDRHTMPTRTARARVRIVCTVVGAVAPSPSCPAFLPPPG